MQLFIITGTSQGLGLSLAERALSEGFHVISIGRKCPIEHTDHQFIQHDLSSPDQLKEKLHTALNNLKEKNFTAIHLINNAAVVTPVGHIESFSWTDISSHMHVNLLMPIYLSGLFLEQTKIWEGARVIANISSGAALRPIDGWSMYCTSKSGLKMFSDCLSGEKNEVKTLNFNPGVMDTNMQSTIREQEEGNFSRVSEFRELKEKNRLAPTDKVAMCLIKLLREHDLIQKNWYDVKDLTT